MSTPPEPTLGQRAHEAGVATDARLVQLRLIMRVVSCDERVRLVGDGHGVELTTDGASRVRVHNELVVLTADDLVDASPEQLRARLRRVQALDQRVPVEVLETRGGGSAGVRRITVAEDCDVL
ncbi:hypothetical protein ER308_11285 [Egibacter rhizosphaerae]|uniref:Uncharacterized protein n=1 Tax=Egibacter rhizosphaerae TaxID=1670831 RepID=A0A411YFV0_9ACTN|nr:hypothetical protein [Egibacter rhizosphaerae]QBI20088.1 hypothetical protein ER308_11285 [Egibacter rhizosphaerae]